MMRIHLDQIGPEGYDLDEPMPAAWIGDTLGKDSVFRPHGDGRLRAHLDRLERGVVHVHGRAQMTIEASCARCLEPLTVPLDSELEVTLFPVGHEPKPRASGEVSDDDMGISSYEGSEIDLGHLVHDEVFLGLPMIPLCREDCRGLCASCGANLNHTQCQCQPPKDSRWQALLNFKRD